MSTPEPLAPPVGLLAELTHRCPLRCPYCSNPVELDRREQELPTESWQRVFGQAGALGVLQVHLSGGEPLARPDLPVLVEACASAGLYSNLITSGLGLSPARLERLLAAGLDHVQLSLQDSEPISAERIAGAAGVFPRKLEAARLVTAAGLPLTVNVVLHRANIARAGEMVDLAVALGARRVEIAHTQYYGWALQNRAALQPDQAQVRRALADVAEAKARHAGQIVVDQVVPDYHARYPKACMGGWA
ncbi:radical SAM protein, partial [Geminicoccus flavidas]|uniref:radical SAM protein n=1 Tax=Geminicoccus flavidas TaxID=2506407 RepID=UPI0013586A1E